jgi:hypothetical protein
MSRRFKANAFGVSQFWPEGQSVHGVYAELGDLPGLSYGGLTKAAQDRLRTTSAEGLFSLQRVASHLAGREVGYGELLVEVATTGHKERHTTS